MCSLTGVHLSTLAAKPHAIGRSDQQVGASTPHQGIFHVYGWTGVLMVAVFLLSALWTLALAVVQLVPSEVANWLMGTGHLDFGDFWTLQKADDGIALTATVLLVAVALGYFGLVVEMFQLSWCSRRPDFRRRSRVEIHPNKDPVQSPAHLAQDQASRAAIAPTTSPALALPKLLLQASLLFKYLRDGFPQTTVLSYASLLFLNWLISTYCAMKQLVDPRTALVRIFSSFDLFFAVYAPMQVLIHAYTHFEFNFAEFATRTEVLNPGNFEVVARLFADPQEVSLFRAAFRSLQFSSPQSLAVKIALNTFTIRKWWRTIRLLSQPDLELQGATTTKRLSRMNAMLFFVMGAAVFVYSVVAVASSTVACARFEQCKVPSYRWNVGALECSCTVFVDRQTIVRTFDEWEDPIDTTVNLARLAASGDLKVVQIVNRQLPTLPDEVRRCTGLEQLILLYTKTITIPTWANELKNLEYLHIEGDFTAKQLQSVPRDLFVNMRKLAFIHLGCLPRLPFVPDLTNLTHLKYLTLAILHSVKEFPNFGSLINLKRLNIVDAIHVPALPSLSPLVSLSAFALGGRNIVCCNGYLSGECDLSRACQGDTDAQRVQCSSQRISSRDRALIDAVGYPVCTDNQLTDFSRSPVSRESTDGACGGLLYKKCLYRGASGMCAPSRWMALSCSSYPPYQAIRRLQIQRGVGDPCDPVVEAWLGCGAR